MLGINRCQVKQLPKLNSLKSNERDEKFVVLQPFGQVVIVCHVRAECPILRVLKIKHNYFKKIIFSIFSNRSLNAVRVRVRRPVPVRIIAGRVLRNDVSLDLDLLVVGRRLA